MGLIPVGRASEVNELAYDAAVVSNECPICGIAAMSLWAKKQPASAPNAPTKPPGWAADGLTAFIEAAHQNQYARSEAAGHGEARRNRRRVCKGH